jgi:hypothetical protein
MANFDGYEKAILGDKRLSTRLKRLLIQLAFNITVSIAAACKDPYQAKAVYRFIANDKVSTVAITEITHDVSMAKIESENPPVVLILQDTSEFNYTNLKATEGLGNIGRRRAAMGIVVHTALAVGEDGVVYGLLSQKIWVRPPEEHSKAKLRKKLPIEEKESFKWLEAIDSTGASFPEGTLTVHVSDRESDIYEYFCKAEKEGANYLCRRFQNRNINGDDEHKKLDDFAGALPVAGVITVHVPRNSHTGRKAREAELEIRYGKCKITKSSLLASNKDLPESVEVYVVSAVEINRPTDEEGISWQLITNVPTECYEDAVARIAWYAQRWKIEIFHRTLKSGCKVEDLQSDSAEKLSKLIAIYSILALETMDLSYLGRAHPEASCEIRFTEEEWKILYRVANKTRELPDKVPTIQEAVFMVAKLGGFLGRKSDGYPGVTVIWRGLTDFYTILDAAQFISA